MLLWGRMRYGPGSVKRELLYIGSRLNGSTLKKECKEGHRMKCEFREMGKMAEERQR